MTEESMNGLLGRIQCVDGSHDLSGVDLAVEAATERFETKVAIMRGIDERLPKEAILATKHLINLDHQSWQQRPSGPTR